MNQQWKNEDVEDEKKSKQDKINQLEAELEEILRTGDESAIKNMRDQVQAAKDELNKYIAEIEREEANKRFDAEAESLDKDLQNKIDAIEKQLGDEDLLALVQSGVRDLSDALNNIDKSTSGVNRSFAYVGDTVGNIGNIIGTTWIDNMDLMISKAKELSNVLSNDIQLNTSDIPTKGGYSNTNSVQVDVGDINIQGLTKEEFDREWNKKGNELFNMVMKEFDR